MSVKLTYEYAKTITVTGAVTTGTDVYNCDATAGSIVLTLPSAAGNGLKGKIFTFTRLDTTTNTVTIAGAGSDTVNTVASIKLSTGTVLKIIKQTSTSWRSLMDSAKQASFQVLTASGNIDPSVNIVQLDTSGAVVAASLPLANTVPLGTKYTAVTTSSLNAGTVIRSGSDTINGATAAITCALNVGKTFFSTSSTAWIQY